MNASLKLYDQRKFKNLLSKKVKEIEDSKNYTSLYKYRVFDLFFSFGAILVFLPILLIISILLKLNSPRTSPFFVQRRLGLDGKPFNVYKFRTMVPNAEEKLEKMLATNKEIKEEYLKFRKLKNDPRIIPKIGNFLRKTSLDELPQFFNVFLGQMSIVGPRPYIENEFDIYPTKSEREAITAVKPGITGYWQIIPERHNTTFKNRVITDIEYIEKKTFWLDLNIIWKTLAVIISGKGA